MEELKLYVGRPADCTGRLEKEIRTYDLLDKLGIQFWRTDHGWMKADTMEDCHVIDACLNATVCKNLFLCNRQKTNFYLLMMPGDKPFKTKELSHQLGIARLSFASPEDMEQYLDCTPGSSSIMGLANDTENKVQLLMDEDIKAGEYLGCHPLHQHLLAQAANGRCAGNFPACRAPRADLCSLDRRITERKTCV